MEGVYDIYFKAKIKNPEHNELHVEIQGEIQYLIDYTITDEWKWYKSSDITLYKGDEDSGLTESTIHLNFSAIWIDKVAFVPVGKYFSTDPLDTDTDSDGLRDSDEGYDLIWLEAEDYVTTHDNPGTLVQDTNASMGWAVTRDSGNTGWSITDIKNKVPRGNHKIMVRARNTDPEGGNLKLCLNSDSSGSSGYESVEEFSLSNFYKWYSSDYLYFDFYHNLIVTTATTSSADVLVDKIVIVPENYQGLVLDPLDRDTDGDGLSDGDETNIVVESSIVNLPTNEWRNGIRRVYSEVTITDEYIEIESIDESVRAFAIWDFGEEVELEEYTYIKMHVEQVSGTTGNYKIGISNYGILGETQARYYIGAGSGDLLLKIPDDLDDYIVGTDLTTYTVIRLCGGYDGADAVYRFSDIQLYTKIVTMNELKWFEAEDYIEYDGISVKDKKASMGRVATREEVTTVDLVMAIRGEIFGGTHQAMVKARSLTDGKSMTLMINEDKNGFYGDAEETTEFSLTTDYRWYTSDWHDFVDGKNVIAVQISPDDINEVYIDKVVVIKEGYEGFIMDPLDSDQDSDGLQDSKEAWNGRWYEGEDIAIPGQSYISSNSKASMGLYVRRYGINQTFAEIVDVGLEGDYEIWCRMYDTVSASDLSVDIDGTTITIPADESIFKWYSVPSGPYTLTSTSDISFTAGSGVIKLDQVAIIPVSSTYRSNPFSSDTDLDGLLDGGEFIEGSNPLVRDTDSDGYLDGEDAFPSDPTEWLDTDEDGIGNNRDRDDDNDGVPDPSLGWRVRDADNDKDGEYDDGGYVVIPGSTDFDFTGDFSLESRIYIENITSDRTIISRYGLGGTGSGEALFNLKIKDSKPVFKIRDDSDLISDSIEGPVLEVYTYYHIAGVREGDQITLYVNGQLVAEKTTTETGELTEFQNNPVVIGANQEYDSDEYINIFEGIIEDVRIWNIARTETEIQDNMDVTLTGTEDGLVGYWKLEMGAAIDVTSNDNNGEYILGEYDEFPLDSGEWVDTDKDGIGNNEDGDDDNDGYLDEWEWFLGTNEKLASSKPVDTDSDGIPNGDSSNSLTWMDTDDDNDGWTDEEEDFYGTVPDNANSKPLDTDGDHIPDGSPGNPESWADTDDDNDGMPDEYEWSWSFLSATDSTDADKDEDGDLLSNLEEYEYSTNPNNADIDNDGLSDYDEVITYGTEHDNADTDNDGINDGSEVTYWGEKWNNDKDGDGKINLLDYDSDNDGLKDGDEGYKIIWFEGIAFPVTFMLKLTISLFAVFVGVLNVNRAVNNL